MIVASRTHRLLLLCGLALILGACALASPRPVAQEDLKAQHPARDLEREKRLLAPKAPPVSEKTLPAAKPLEPTSRLYSITFQKASLSEALAALTRDSEYNLIIDADVDLTRSITVRLNKVMLSQALDMIVVNGAGYAWSANDGALHIRRFAEKIYHLDHLDLTGETNIEVGGDLLASGVNSTSVAGKYQVKVKKPEQSSDL